MNNEYHNLGNSLLESGRFDEAAAAYKQAVELHPDFSWSYHSLGDVLVKLEQWKEAVVAYNKAVELNPDFAWSYHNLGDALLKLQRWEDAIAAYRCEIELKSDFAWSFCNLGDALTQLKYWDEAFAAYLKAVEIDGDLPGIYDKLGYALRQTESDLKSVLQQCQLQVTPENREFYLDLSRSLARCDRPNSAIIFCKLLLTNQPTCDVWAAQLGEFLQEQEKCDRALASARATVAQKPDDCWSYYNLGAVLSHQKKWDEAATSFLKAIEINPDFYWWFYYNLWEVLVKQNKLEEVASLYRGVVAAQPEAFWPYLNLGEVLTRQGKIEEAISCYQTVSYRQVFASLLSKDTGKMPVPQDLISLLLLGYAASFCTKLSDTCASEIGKAYGKRTFLITTLQPVPRGTEGAVSLEGTIAGIVGSILMALVSSAVGLIDLTGIAFCVIAAFIATNIESVIGATIQSQFEWLTNEVVNFFNTFIGAIAAIVLASAWKTFFA